MNKKLNMHKVDIFKIDIYLKKNSLQTFVSNDYLTFTTR